MELWKTRDLTLVILLAVVSFIYTQLIGQLGNVITGIQGFNYFFIIGHMIFISFGFLIYGGRRWILLLQGILAALLTLTTFLSGVPFDIVSKIPMVLTSFFGDLIFNSFYSRFENRNKLNLLALLVVIGYMLMLPVFVSLNMFLFYLPQALNSYLSVYVLLFPVTLIETIIGGFIGYQIFKRVKNV